MVELRAVGNALEIRKAATRLFAEQGVGGTSLQAIADKVGVTKQTLLYHYPSKEALWRSVLESVFEHWRERLPRLLEAVTGGRGRFQALTRELLHFFESDPDRARLLVREMLDHPEAMRRLLGENLRPWVLLVGQYVREGQRLGGIHADADPEAYVWSVIALAVCSVAARDVAGAVLGGEGDAYARQRAELLRLTQTGLFTGARPPAPTEESS